MGWGGSFWIHSCIRAILNLGGMNKSEVKATDNSPTNVAEREIVMTRRFMAPRGTVFTVWTDPDHIGKWWGPNGFTTTTHVMDVRPGGEWRFVMHGPDGTDYDNRIVYVEVNRLERLVYKHGSDEENNPNPFVTTVTFKEQDGKTVVTMHMLFSTVEERDRTIGFGAVELGYQTLDRLAEHLGLTPERD